MTTPSLSPFTRIVGLLFFVLALCFVVGCDSPSSTIREIRRNLDTFKSSPNLQSKEALEKSFAKMEVQIQELEAKGVIRRNVRDHYRIDNRTSILTIYY